METEGAVGDRVPGGPGWVVEVKNLGKSFPGVCALQGVDLALRPGEVHAVVGENGAGKSTLMRILAGLERPDTGTICFRGREVRLRHPHHALELGVAMIHQELMPFPELSVAENILIGREPTRGWWGWVDRGAMRREAEALLARLDLPVAPERPLRELGVAERQAVEIARALGARAQVIIMDEPTSALSVREAEALFRVIGELRRQGVAILYVSHRLEEVMELADAVTVLRDGRRVFTGPVGTLSRERLIGFMAGRSEAEGPALALRGRARGADREEPSVMSARWSPGADSAPGQEPPRESAAGCRGADALLSVAGLGRAGVFEDVSFDLRRGEVLGLTGLVGAGRTKLAHALFGLHPAEAGAIRVRGAGVRIGSPRDALALGLALVTEDRKHDGLVLTMSVMHNLTLAGLERCSPGGWIRGREEARCAEGLIRDYGVKVAHRNQAARVLSGGNQQKVALAKALFVEPQILILDEPTRGIDIGAKAEVHDLIRRLARGGKAILLISSEIPEVLGLSDRVLVMRQGRLCAELDPRRASAEDVLHCAVPGGEPGVPA